MQTVDIVEAEANFEELVDRVLAGEEIAISKSGRPLAKLVPLEKPKRGIKLGVAAGEFTVPDDFDDPLPDEILALFYGEEDDDLPKTGS